MDRGAGARHVGDLRRIADHLERIIGLDGRGDVEAAVVIERPAMVEARLAAAQVGGDFGFHRGIDRLAEIMAQQDVFGGDGGVGFEFEDPVAVIALLGEQRI